MRPKLENDVIIKPSGLRKIISQIEKTKKSYKL